MPRDTQWLAEAKWGVMTHFLPRLPGPAKDDRVVTAEEWNEQVEAVDVEALAQQLKELGAGYLILTIGQHSGHLCSPNETYDRIAGVRPSKCSRRDLIAEAGTALRKRGLRLIAYVQSRPPADEPGAREGFGWTDAAKAADPRLTGMQEKWNAALREWSLRWGPLVSGWWVDSCYEPAMYEGAEPNWSSFAGAMRAGNPDSLVAFNPGILWPLKSLTSEDDYLAGEVDGAFFAGYWVKNQYNQLPAVYQDARLHVLSFLGTMWNQGDGPRFPDEFVIGYTKFLNSRGGAVSWDVPIEPGCRIRPAFLGQLNALGAALA